MKPLFQSFTYSDPQYNKVVSVNHVSLESDAELIYQWMHQKHLAPFWKLDIPFDEFQAYLKKSIDATHKDIYIASLDSEPVCYFIIYQVEEDQIKNYYDHDASDIGAHFAIGKREYLKEEYIIPLTRGLISFGFHMYETERCVVEPDVRNRIVIPALQQCGFDILSEIQLPHKKAKLMMIEKKMFISNMSQLQSIQNGEKEYVRSSSNG
ncbi:GNAT family N-acetyltransferase [Longirhabdus pacifica]|uniref:GNAT family N-acetyltransferase n=1 Tax=Longirhabdus pacifica TaxID=2305227 RepID=UPI00100925B4|nr:GNAT family N-acetyltransferase [Longirhabdus pacifica]